MSNNAMSHNLTPAKLATLRALPGNGTCADCSAVCPDWASLTYGTLLCIECAGLHRGLGVHLSFVRSLSMDSWTNEQYARMVTGGNDRWKDYFFRRDGGGDNTTTTKTNTDGKVDPKTAMRMKYESETARTYRERLDACDLSESNDDCDNAVVSTTTTGSVPPIRRAVILDKDPPPTARECYNILMRTVYEVARRSKFARRVVLGWAMTGLSIALYGTRYVIRRRQTMVECNVVSSSLPNINPAAHKYMTGSTTCSSMDDNNLRIILDVAIAPCIVAVIFVGLPYLLIRHGIRKMAQSYIDNRQESFKSARNLLVERIQMGRAKRHLSCDAYYPTSNTEDDDGPHAKCGLVFFPGALVDRAAYAPIAALLSDRGILVVVVNLEPFRLVMTTHDYPLREVTMRTICDAMLLSDGATWTVDEWATGGHSMGSHLAIAAVTNELSSSMKKVVMWGVMSYPSPLIYPCGDLRDVDNAKALVVNGTEDGLIKSTYGGSPEEKAANFESRMPPRYLSKVSPTTTEEDAVSSRGEERGCTYFVTIKGGNHSGCAHYGPQMFPIPDGVRSITLDEQQLQMAELTADFLLDKLII